VTATPEPEIQNDSMSDDFVIVRRLKPTPDDAFAVFLAGNAEEVFSVPDGAMSHGFRDIATAEVDGAATTVRFRTGEGGEVRAEQQVAGAWQLPRMGLTKRPVGMSADGSTIVLEQAESSRKSTSFALVKSSGADAVRVLTFPGDLSFDALAPDGAWLYVLAHQADGTYQVRKASTATGALDPNVIVDKRNPGEVMSGYAITQLASRGWVYTLYQGPEGPFVHALSTNDGAALCIDLPADGKSVSDTTTAAWGLAVSPSGRSLYAANSAVGAVTEISLQDFTVKRSKALSDDSAAVELAKFENGDWNDAGSVAVSPDGKVLYVGGAHGVAAIRAKDFGSIATLGGDRGYRSVAVGGGGRVYAIDTGGALHRLGSAVDPDDLTLATEGMALIEGVLTVGG
jgi:hypothetical protein